ncbi:MAG: hypothetical protein ACD_21C00129G0001 [uncultured bacterium]|nr:MAG: hypothetical protein ACD_21C00129G0001 [uncultured bacterium]
MLLIILIYIFAKTDLFFSVLPISKIVFSFFGTNLINRQLAY